MLGRRSSTVELCRIFMKFYLMRIVVFDGELIQQLIMSIKKLKMELFNLVATDEES